MEMEFQIKNFGKIKNATIQLCPFTIIAGPNSSGKSFVTKALYSIFHAINQNLFINELIKNLEDIEYHIRKHSMKESLLLSFLEIKSNIQEKIISLTLDSNKQKTLDFISEQLAWIQDIFKDAINQEKNFENIQKKIQKLKHLTDHYEATYTELLQDALQKEFIENFQIESLDILTRSKESLFEIPNLGQLKIKNKKVHCSLSKDDIAKFQELHNVVFLESPIYFKLKTPLRNVRFSRPDLFLRKGFLTQVPKYFYDVDSLLDSKIIQKDHAFNKIAKQIDEKIGGGLMLSENGIVFSEDTQEEPIPLNMVSSGISNLGMIALLIKQNILSKGSYLIIDEPEVNLHTEWQHLMLDILVQLSEKGVHVVIATHSLDMLFRLEYIVQERKKKNVKVENHFSINRLNLNGTSEKRGELLEDIRKAKINIGKPYAELFEKRLP